MNRPSVAEVERSALALFERLSDEPHMQAELLAAAPEAVRSRVKALLGGLASARAALPTDSEGGRPIEPPDRVGPFRLVAPIGAGGMGSVWRAERDDGLYEQTVAVKFIHAELGPVAAARFAEERRLLAKLEAPSIARVIDGGVTADGLAYVVMEYVDGEPIDAALRGRPARERARLAAEAVEAVQFAHSRLVVHGDLKPSNIMVGRDGRVRLLDFGVARLLGAEGDGGGPAPMTRAFASPQRAAGGPPSIADDVFALGVILADLTADLEDRDLAAIAAKASAPDEAARYGSAAAMAADLGRWRDRLPVSARGDSLGYRAGRFLARHAAGVAITAAVILALGASAGVATANYLAAEHARAQAEQRFAEVRAISNYMLFDLYDRLADAPGTVQARIDLAERARRYLDRLAASRGAPAELRLEVAYGYQRLARVQGVTGVASLGRPSDAIRSLDRAEALAKGVLADAPANVAAQELLGLVQGDRWTLAPDTAEKDVINERARSYFLRALSLEPERRTARLGLLETEKNRAYDLTWAENKPAAAIPVLKAALTDLRARHIDTDESRLLEVDILNRLGDAMYNAGDIAGSLEPYREAEAIVDRRLAKGEALTWLSRKGESDWNISGSLGDTGRTKPALAKAREGVAVLKRVLSYGPDANAEKRLLILYGQEANLLSELGRREEALTPAAESVRLREARARLQPDDPKRARDLAIGLATAADVYARAGRRAEACRLAMRTVDQWAAIEARGRLSRRDAEKNQPDARKARATYCE